VGPENPPSWAAHLANPARSYASMQEIGMASGDEYRHFSAVLSPRRTFLHYLISEMICSVSVPNKEFLAEQVNRLYQQHADKACALYEEVNSKIFADRRETYRQLADEYFENKKHNRAFTSSISGLILLDEHIFDWLVSPQQRAKEITIDTSIRDYWKLKIKDALAELYSNLERSMNDPHLDYIPGGIDSNGLNDFKKVFVAAFVDRAEQKQIESVTRSFARNIIQEEIKKEDGPLKRLPRHYDQSNCKHTVITGVMAAGKTVLLKQLEAQGKIDRRDCVMIDIDEFRDLEKIIKPEATIAPGDEKAWANRAHEESHMIRRKILDRLDEMAKPPKAKKGEKQIRALYPNVVLLTSFVSPRIRHWLTEGNPETKVYALYCAPDQALKNAYERGIREKRYLSTELVLESIKDLSTTVRYLFGVETGTGNNLSLEVIDTTNAIIKDGPKGPHDPVMIGERQVLRADRKHQVQVFDANALKDIHRAYYINSKATSPNDSLLYSIPDDSKLRSQMLASMRPHKVSFCKLEAQGSGNIRGAGNSRKGICFAIKHPYEKALHTATNITTQLGTILSGSETLQFLFQYSPLNGPGQAAML
jgi:hypothetical protein